MKIRAKTKLYLVLAITGIVLAVVSKLALHNIWNNTQIAAAIGIGARFSRWEEKNPEFMKQNAIEAIDERNQLIRSKAQALSGEVLHWLMIAGAWIAIFFNAPLWITLVFVGVFLLKTILDFVIMAYYQRKL